MKPRLRLSPPLVKLHCSYTVDDLARTGGAHKNMAAEMQRSLSHARRP
jgi:hypothetical protein